MSYNVSILYDHYKDTCSIVSEAIKRRDRLMFFVIVAVGFFAFQTISPNVAGRAITDFLNFKFGLALQIDLSIIGNIVWSSVLLFTIRYFQISVFVERQYAYLHQLEDKLNQSLGKEMITREGKHYLAGYPKFSDWIWILYTIIFPVLLFFVAFIKIIGEWLNFSSMSVSFDLLFNTLMFLLLAISIWLYLWMLHASTKVIA